MLEEKNPQLQDHIFLELTCIKDKIIKSNIWPKSLSGACNVASILTQAVLEKNGVESTLVNNHKHSFNIIKFHGSEYVIDLTAGQISEEKFPEKVVFKEWKEVNSLANSTFRGKSYYYLEPREDFFFSRGTLREVLRVNDNFRDDDKELFRILENVCNVSQLTLDLELEINPQNVNNLAVDIIEQLTA